MMGVSVLQAGLNKFWCDPQGRFLFYAALFFAISIPLNYLMLQITGWSVLWPTRTWMTGGAASSGDSWHVMQIALDWIRSNPDGGLYKAIFFEGQSKFQYAPTSLLPMVGLEALGITPSSAVLNSLNWVFIAITAAAVSALTYVLLGKTQTAPTRLVRAGAALLTGIAVLFWAPNCSSGQFSCVQNQDKTSTKTMTCAVRVSGVVRRRPPEASRFSGIISGIMAR